MILTVTLNPSLDEWITLKRLDLGRVNRSAAFSRYPGGKGIDVSRVVHELGGETLALAVIGGDDGRIFQSMMEKKYGVPCAFEHVEGLTRNNYKLEIADRRGITEINNAGPKVSAAAAERLKRRALGIKPRPTATVLAGSLPPGLPKSIYAAWIRALNKAGHRTVLDTSGEALSLGAAARPWLIKPNQHELSDITGKTLRSRAALIRTAKELARSGPENVIVSLGAEGALLASREEGAWFGAAPEVKVISTVGSGDSLIAGLTWAMERGEGLARAFQHGIAAGSACAMTSGTELVHRKDFFKLLPKVRVTRA